MFFALRPEAWLHVSSHCRLTFELQYAYDSGKANLFQTTKLLAS